MPTLGLNERLRPWSAAGVRYILRQTQQAQAAADSAAPGSAPDTDDQISDAMKPANAVSMERFEQYRSSLQRPCRTLWTYWELAYDLGGQPDDNRRELFKRIIHHLQWPARSITFWPTAFLDNHEPVPDAEIFAKGLEESGASVVFCFGRRALEVVSPSAHFQPGTIVQSALPVYVLPGPSELLHNVDDAKRMAWRMLKSFDISSCPLGRSG